MIGRDHCARPQFRGNRLSSSKQVNQTMNTGGPRSPPEASAGETKGSKTNQRLVSLGVLSRISFQTRQFLLGSLSDILNVHHPFL